MSPPFWVIFTLWTYFLEDIIYPTIYPDLCNKHVAQVTILAITLK